MNPIGIVQTIIVAISRVVMPVILNPPRQFALVFTLELILLVLVDFVIIPSVFRMSSVLSLLLLRDVPSIPTVIYLVVMVVVFFRTILHITGPANVITNTLQIIVAHLVEMRIATIRNPVCMHSTTVYIVFPMMT